MSVPEILLSGPGVPDEAFALQVYGLFDQPPEPETIPIKKLDLEKSTAVIDFMQELASKQDELLVSVIKIINGIEVAQAGSEGSPAWNTVKQSVSKDYDNIVRFCQAGLDRLLIDYPQEETDANSEGD